MKKLPLLFLVLSTVIFSACGPKTSPPTSPQASSNNSDSSKSRNSLLEMLQSGQTVKCTYNLTTDKATQEGTVYTANGQTRMDITMAFSAEGRETTTASHIITTGQYQYLWGDASPKGTKIKMTPEDVEKMKNQAQDQSDVANRSQGIDWNQKMDFSCQPWQADQSVFQPPSTVQFEEIDVGEMAKQAEEARQKICDLCDQLSGPAKEQCQQSCTQPE